jgi:hypothetical protein
MNKSGAVGKQQFQTAVGHTLEKGNGPCFHVYLGGDVRLNTAENLPPYVDIFLGRGRQGYSSSGQSAEPYLS